MFNSSDQNIGAVVFWFFIFSLFAVFVYIGFYHPREDGHDHEPGLWYCGVVSSENPVAQRFYELEPGAQSFLVYMRDSEKSMFDSIPELVKLTENILIKMRKNGDSDSDISMFEREIERLNTIEKRPREWEILEQNYYSCIGP